MVLIFISVTKVIIGVPYLLFKIYYFSFRKFAFFFLPFQKKNFNPFLDELEKIEYADSSTNPFEESFEQPTNKNPFEDRPIGSPVFSEKVRSCDLFS